MNLFYLIGLILMVLGAFNVPAGRCDLWKLGWAFVIAGLTFVGYVSLGAR